MSGREQYTSAPLAIVTAQVNFTYEPDLRRASVRDTFATAIREHFPVLENEQVASFGAPDEEGGPPQLNVLPQIRAIAADRRVTVALNPESLIVAMDGRAYTRYGSSLGTLIGRVVHALYAVAPSTAIKRAGIRYIDEVRVPEPPADFRGWSTWVRSELFGLSAAVKNLEPKAFWSVTQLRFEPDTAIQFAYGLFKGTTVVDESLPFGRQDQSVSEMFVLDADTAWTPAVPTLIDAETLVAKFEELHEPAGELFESAITDSARAMFRGPREAA